MTDDAFDSDQTYTPPSPSLDALTPLQCVLLGFEMDAIVALAEQPDAFEMAINFNTKDTVAGVLASHRRKYRMTTTRKGTDNKVWLEVYAKQQE